jgi:hypothetical protein
MKKLKRTDMVFHQDSCGKKLIINGLEYISEEN